MHFQILVRQAATLESKHLLHIGVHDDFDIKHKNNDSAYKTGQGIGLKLMEEGFHLLIIFIAHMVFRKLGCHFHNGLAL